MLGEAIPCAEMTLFGKNGSDVCSAAVRMARVFTGRPKILFSGYSGWQDPFAAAFEPALAQPALAPRRSDFPPTTWRAAHSWTNTPGRSRRCLWSPPPKSRAWKVQCAVPDADFLRGLADACRAHGALLVFDEILTGFRHPSGSVERATGVIPDLACFGKAPASGMPLSVLVGRREIMAETIRRIFYHPTYKAEAYSFAAAAAALRIYASQDVPCANRAIRLAAATGRRRSRPRGGN